MSKTAVPTLSREKTPAPVPAPAQAATVDAAAPASPEPITGIELLDWLHKSGMPPRLDDRRADVDQQWLREHQGATGEALYRRLEETHAKTGTLRRAGKRLWGDGFEPENVVKLAPADELLRLREENGRLASNNAMLTAEKLGMQSQNGFLRQQINELTRVVEYLKIGRTPEDLATIGLGPAAPTLRG